MTGGMGRCVKDSATVGGKFMICAAGEWIIQK